MLRWRAKWDLGDDYHFHFVFWYYINFQMGSIKRYCSANSLVLSLLYA